MPLTKEQIVELKNQLSQQIQHLPEEQKHAAQEQINAMSDEAIEALLKQQTSKSGSKQDILRQIVRGDIPAKKIDENKQAIAVLDIRPVSKGHIIIILKNKVTVDAQIPTQAFTLAKKLAKKLALKLKTKGVEIQTENKFSEVVINIIPYYDQPLSVNSPRYEAQEKELQELYALLYVKKKSKIINLSKKTPQKPSSSLPKIKRRIP